MMCLNPIIADIKYTRVDGKATLFNFRNFKNEVMKNGDDKMLDLLNNGRQTLRYKDGMQFYYKENDVILLPCRKCVNCQLNRSREWAIRNSLEARDYDDNCKMFLTLTYNDDSFKNNVSRNFTFKNKLGREINIPTLNYTDVQKFLKRFRKYFSNYTIKYYLCGEYGGITHRPHYHILLYGLPLSAIEDLDLTYETKDGIFYKSECIEKLWNLGFVNISTFSNYTAMYTARYCTKKHMQDDSLNYCLANREFRKEFNRMSLKPSIATNYIINEFENVFKYDEFLFHIDDKTFKLKPLKFFDRKYDIENPTQMKFIKENRKKFAQEHSYFENLENNYGIIDYLNNIESETINKLSSRKNSEV